MDFLKVAAGISLILVSGGYVYKSVHTTAPEEAPMPAADQAAAPADARPQTEVEYAEAETAEPEQSQSERRRDAYDQCLRVAADHHRANWEASCRYEDEQRQAALAGCLADPVFIRFYGTEQCHKTHGRDASSRCTVAFEVGWLLTDDYQREKDRCIAVARL